MKADVKVGERAVEKLVDAAIDAFSPATETLGLLGDAVRLARVEVAAAITRKAKAIAEKEGLKLTAPPLKFLVPFYEKASTEDIEDDTLMEMWARLLTSAGSGYDSRYMRYTGLLSEMSPVQARILQGIAHNFNGVIGVDLDQDQFFYNMVESRLINNLKAACETESDAGNLFELARKELCVPGVSMVGLTIEMKLDKSYYDYMGEEKEIYSDKLSIEFEVLRSFGLIGRINTDFFELPLAFMSVNLYHMTELGYDFWSTCCGGAGAK